MNPALHTQTPHAPAREAVATALRRTRGWITAGELARATSLPIGAVQTALTALAAAALVARSITWVGPRVVTKWRWRDEPAEAPPLGPGAGA